MPSLTFVLPHWLYWSGLIVFPLIAMYVVRRHKMLADSRKPNLAVGYMFWLCGGFVGLHRFYARNLWGVIYIPLFIAVLFANVEGRDARDDLSRARNAVIDVEFDVERFEKAVQDEAEGAAEKLAKAKEAVPLAKRTLTDATDNAAFWNRVSGGVALAIAILLVIDAFLLVGLVRKVADREGEPEDAGDEFRREVEMAGTHEDPAMTMRTPLTRLIDRVSGFAGEFVSYWSIIAVFVYYYEVVARYVFNSPTNWAHESMFLMFGMQYLLSGAYALREDSHVRVDVIYMHLPDRTKVITDVITSVFFFVFTTTLLVTGWIFMVDSINVWEVSFTEWAIQYWPVKVTIALGALILLLQGISKLFKDFALLAKTGS